MMTGTEGTIGVFVSLNTLGLSALGWFTSKLRRDANRIDTMEDRVMSVSMEAINQKHEALIKLFNEKHVALTTLLDERHELTGKLIDERLRRITHDMSGSAQANMFAVDAVTKRMDQAMEKLEKTIDSHTERDHGLEIKLLTQINKVQMEISEKAATKSDLKEHQNTMSQQVRELRAEVNETRRKGSNGI